MKSLRIWLILFALALSCLYTLQVFSRPSPGVVAEIDLQEALSDDRGEFADVVPGRSFSFPADHGEHPEFKTEWWYFNGNLSNEQGEQFGYQLTLFRVGLSKNNLTANPSAWSTDSLLMGHFAVSDLEAQQFLSFERFARRSLGLAGVEPEGRRIWLENWSIERLNEGWTLKALAEEDEHTVRLELSLEETKAPILQGDQGYSRKGPEAKHASYYVSQTRLKSNGKLEFDGKTHSVEGTSWFDHEWSSEAMAEGLAGWDWFSLQLSDDTELMIYLLRYEDGRIEPASSGSFVNSEGQKRNLALQDFEVLVQDRYQSQRGVEYPNRWKISVPSVELKIQVDPLMADQEMTSGVPYWEGAVSVSGTQAGNEVTGRGFVEMTGY